MLNKSQSSQFRNLSRIWGFYLIGSGSAFLEYILPNIIILNLNWQRLHTLLRFMAFSKFFWALAKRYLIFWVDMWFILCQSEHLDPRHLRQYLYSGVEGSVARLLLLNLLSRFKVLSSDPLWSCLRLNEKYHHCLSFLSGMMNNQEVSLLSSSGKSISSTRFRQQPRAVNIHQKSSNLPTSNSLTPRIYSEGR